MKQTAGGSLYLYLNGKGGVLTVIHHGSILSCFE
jgi:hypothetical protein